MDNEFPIFMLAAHEPLDDPRVSWVAASLAKRYRTEVLGLANPDALHPEREERQGFKILRFRRQLGGPGPFASQCVRTIVRLILKHNLAMRVVAIATAPVAVLLLPLIFLVEAVSSMLGWLVRSVPKAIRRLAPLSFFASTTFLRLASQVLRGRSNAPLETTPTAFENYKWLLRHIIGSNEIFVRHIEGELWQRPALVYCNDLDTLMAGIYLKRAYGIPVVYDSHENWPYSLPGAPWYHIFFFRLFERSLIREADAVITVSDPLAEHLRRDHGIVETTVIANAEPLSTHSIKPSQSSLSALANGRVSILFQGAFAPRRGLDEVLSYWPAVDGTKVALFLRGRPNAERQRLEALARDLGILDNSIYFLPPVTEDELVTASAEADVGLIPYRSDLKGYVVACPNKLSQYMQAGCAILTADLPFVRKVVEAANAGASYSFRSKKSFVTAVERLSEREVLKQMQANARSYTETTYNWQAYEPALFGVIDSAIARGRPDPRHSQR